MAADCIECESWAVFICINNLADGEMVCVYDTNGRMVRQETASSEQMRIKLDNHGVYIVKAGVKTLKLNL